MYSYGLVRFLQAKKLKSKEAINAFLQSEGITAFTARQSYKADAYINKNWGKFHSFIDRSIKSGTISGQRVRLNYNYEIEEQREQQRRDEFATLSPEQNQFYSVIKKYDDVTRLSKVASYIKKTYGVDLPKNSDGDHATRALKMLPKIQFIIDNGWMSEVIDHLKNS